MILTTIRHCLGAIFTPGLLSLTLFSLLCSVAYYSYAYEEIEPSPRVELIMYFLWLTILGWYLQRRERITGYRLHCCCRYILLAFWPITVPLFFFRSERRRDAALRALAVHILAALPIAGAYSGAMAAEARYASADQVQTDDGYCAGDEEGDEGPDGHAATGDSYENDDEGAGDDDQQAAPDDDDEEDNDEYEDAPQAISV